jgi:hypothetical protein
MSQPASVRFGLTIFTVKDPIMIKTQASSLAHLGNLWKPGEEVDRYPLKVCVVSENEACARSAVRMLQRVSKTTNLKLTLLHLDKYGTPSNSDSLAPAPLDSELFIVAMTHGGELPGFIKTWIEQWACLRREDNDCALVAFVTNGSPPLDSRAPLVEYLGDIAAACALAFFYGKSQDSANSESPQPHERDAHSNTAHRIVVDLNLSVPRWGINE